MSPITDGHKIILGVDYFVKGFSAAQLSAAYYRLVADKKQEGLLLETATLEEVENAYLPEWDENDRLTTDEMVLEAIRIQKYSRTDSKMAALVRVFNGYLKEKGIEALAPIIGTPKKSGLFASVVVQIPFSDGQVISIVFHSPDNDKMKITADDEILAFRWLLNKRDITQVVSPEGNADVSLQEIGKRISQLVEKNSARFQASQKAIVEQKQQLGDLKTKYETLTATHDDLMNSLQSEDDLSASMDLQEKNIKDRILTQQEFNESLRAKIDALKAKQAGNAGIPDGGTTPKTDAEMKAEQEKTEFESKKASFMEELKGRGYALRTDDAPAGDYSVNGSIRISAQMVTDGNAYSIDVLYISDDGKEEDKSFAAKTIKGCDAAVNKALSWIDAKLAEVKNRLEEQKAAAEEQNTPEQDQQKQATGSNAETADPTAVSILNDIVAGKYGNDTNAIGQALDDAAAELESAGLLAEYDQKLNEAADYLTTVLKEKAMGVAA